MKTTQKMIGLSMIVTLLVGCGASGTLSPRETSTTPTEEINETETTTVETNYIITPKVEPLTTEQEHIVQVHNERRHNEFDDAPMHYSLELEKVALAYAKELAQSGKVEHDPNNARNGYGENLFANSEDKNITIDEAMIHWYDNEKVMYDYETNECNTSKAIENIDNATCGHYTQVVWQETREVGCATVNYINPESLYANGSIYVCRYQKPGNVQGEKPYCTNYTTSDIYTGVIPKINTQDITGKDLSIELIDEDRVNCIRRDNSNGSIRFEKGFKSATLIDFDIFNGDKYTTTLQFDNVEIVDDMVKLSGVGISEEHYPIFMNIKFISDNDTYYGVELEWNGYNANDATFSRNMKAKFYK